VDCQWQKVSCEAVSVCSDSWVVFLAGHPQEAISLSIITLLECDGLLPHFVTLHRMIRKTLASRIGYSEAILAYERNLLDALMKPVHFDIFEYIVDEIWNITKNPLRSCGFPPYIQYMIEVVTKEKLYKDVAHEPLHPTVPKDPMAPRAGSSTPTASPSCTTHSGGDSSAPSLKFSILKMFWGTFATCRCMD
jgi:hypothetical protein